LGAVAFRNRTRIRDICRQNSRLAEEYVVTQAPPIGRCHNLSVSCQRSIRVAADESCTISFSCQSKQEQASAEHLASENDDSLIGQLKLRAANKFSVISRIKDRTAVSARETTTFDVGKQQTAVKCDGHFSKEQPTAVTASKFDSFCIEEQQAAVLAARYDAYSIGKEQQAAVCSIVQLRAFKNAANHSETRDGQPEVGKQGSKSRVVAAAAKTFRRIRKPVQMFKVRTGFSFFFKS